MRLALGSIRPIVVEMTEPTLAKLHLLLPLLALGVLAPSCGTSEPEPDALEARALYGFDSCEAMLDYTRGHALSMLEATGGEIGVDIFFAGGDDFGGALEGDDGAQGGDGAPAYSETNIQEAGVDEPDLVKTDGQRILALAEGQLHYVDTTGMVAELAGSLDLPEGWDPQLFIHGDRALVLMRSDQWESELVDMPALWQEDYSWVPLTMLIEVDISDPGAMAIIRTLHVGADMISARKVEGSVRVVLRSWPIGLELLSWYDLFYDGEGGTEPSDPGEPEPVPAPAPDQSAPEIFRAGEITEDEAKAMALAHNEAVLAASTPENWLPQFVLDSGGETTMGLLYDCDQAMRPGVESGLGVVSVLTVSLDDELEVEDGTGLFSSGETVYASRESLYVATHPWINWFVESGDIGVSEGQGGAAPMTEGLFRADEDGVSSYVHKFDISDALDAEYVASGQVRGRVLNQFSMSEREGMLRLATTDGWAWDEQDPSESFVTVLGEGEELGELVQIGQVGGLGQGERIYSVRFIDEVAYVVTFRETDPLYTVDVSDPSAPEVRGELKINGYSAYLHPLDETHLLGIGQDATEDGQTLGTQVSIFDVSDLADPVRTHQFTLAEGYSEAEYDHHAFLYWEPEQLAVFPMTVWQWDGQADEVFVGAMALRVDPDSGIEELAAIEHPTGIDDDYGAQPRRSLVIGDTLYTVSSQGILASGLDDFAAQVFIEF